MSGFNGLGMHLGNLSRLSKAQTRSISAENFTGEKGKGGMATDGLGAIQQTWFTPTGHWRYTILRIYWDGQEQPSVECPVGDFFACGWGEYAHVNSLPGCVNPGSAFNCYWEMPFRKRCRITVENIA